MAKSGLFVAAHSLATQMGGGRLRPKGGVALWQQHFVFDACSGDKLRQFAQ